VIVVTSNLFYITNPTGYAIYLQDNIEFAERNSGGVELLIAHLIDYLNTYFPKFKQTAGSTGTSVTFTFGYPQDSTIEINLPIIAISSRDDEHFIDSAGYIQADVLADDGDIVYGVQYKPTLEIDIWARDTREKAFIQGILINMLHAGIANGLLRQRGIQVIEFTRSIPRGYDQADRVLQFHTHQIGSDEIFRQVLEFDFTFDHRLIWDFTDPNSSTVAYAIRQIIMGVNEETQNLYSNVKGQSTIVYIA